MRQNLTKVSLVIVTLVFGSWARLIYCPFVLCILSPQKYLHMTRVSIVRYLRMVKSQTHRKQCEEPPAKYKLCVLAILQNHLLMLCDPDNNRHCPNVHNVLLFKYSKTDVEAFGEKFFVITWTIIECLGAGSVSTEFKASISVYFNRIIANSEIPQCKQTNKTISTIFQDHSNIMYLSFGEVKLKKN